ncbi:MAG: hypothetical protein P8Q92_11605 [Pseudoprimorskyibacter sp.]|nr:hypothetical protein [Pseudoprimorskyibacter sp.]
MADHAVEYTNHRTLISLSHTQASLHESQTMDRLQIYIPLLVIALIDFLLFFKRTKTDGEPATWRQRMKRANRKRRLKYKIGLARARDDAGYGAG